MNKDSAFGLLPLLLAITSTLQHLSKQPDFNQNDSSQRRLRRGLPSNDESLTAARLLAPHDP